MGSNHGITKLMHRVIKLESEIGNGRNYFVLVLFHALVRARDRI